MFARNWLLAGSLSVALAYKRSTGGAIHRSFSLSEFKFNNINIDGIGRFGLVWNNSKWYAGMSGIFHAYNYHRSKFSTNNFFGSVNIYCGLILEERKIRPNHILLGRKIRLDNRVGTIKVNDETEVFLLV